MIVPNVMPTAQPAISAQRWNHREYRPTITAGSVWMIHTPPSSWKSIAYLTGARMMISSAPTLTTSEVSLATRASSSSVAAVWTYSFHTLRVNRLAAAIDITAAGTSAPIAIAPKATPTNHDGNTLRKRSGTAKLGFSGVIPRAIAM